MPAATDSVAHRLPKVRVLAPRIVHRRAATAAAPVRKPPLPAKSTVEPHAATAFVSRMSRPPRVPPTVWRSAATARVRPPKTHAIVPTIAGPRAAMGAARWSRRFCRVLPTACRAAVTESAGQGSMRACAPPIVRRFAATNAADPEKETMLAPRTADHCVGMGYATRPKNP